MDSNCKHNVFSKFISISMSYLSRENNILTLSMY